MNATTRGHTVFISAIIAIMGFAMGVGGVIAYMRAQDNDYAVMAYKFNGIRAELEEKQRAFDTATEGVGKFIAEFRTMQARIDALEKRSPVVDVKLTEPILVDVVQRTKTTQPRKALGKVPPFIGPHVQHAKGE